MTFTTEQCNLNLAATCEDQPTFPVLLSLYAAPASSHTLELCIHMEETSDFTAIQRSEFRGQNYKQSRSRVECSG